MNTDMGFVSAPVSATAAEVHEYVEVWPHHNMLLLCELGKCSWLAGRPVLALLIFPPIPLSAVTAQHN